MTPIRRCCGAAVMAMCALCVAPAVVSSDDPFRLPYEIIPADQIDRDVLSPIGRRLLRKTDEWVAGRSRHFYAMASSVRAVSSAIDEAEFAWTWLDAWLGSTNAPDGRALVVIVDDSDLWKTMVKKHRLRHDSLAMQIQQELYLKDDPGQAARPDRIAHEVVHVRLFHADEKKVPLWLEEGLANYAGWRCAVEYNRAKGITLYRSLPALEDALILPLSDLLAQREYPADPAAAMAFYRQSEELVAALVETYGQAAVASLIDKAGVIMIDHPVGLREALSLNEQQLDALEQQVALRSREAVKF